LQVKVSWYEVDADGNERLIHSKTQHDSTVDFLAEQEYPENQGEIFGMSETLNRICLDPYLLNPHHTYRFKCHAESVCHSQKVDSEVFSVRRRGKYLFNFSLLINLIEFTYKFLHLHIYRTLIKCQSTCTAPPSPSNQHNYYDSHRIHRSSCPNVLSRDRQPEA
jgi:hypothetical protein